MVYVKAVIFDMDGVIIDSEPAHLRINNKMFEKLKIDVSDEEKLKFVGATTSSVWEIIKGKYNLSYSIGELVKMDRDLYMKDLKSTSNIKPITGVDVLIKKFYKNKLKLAIASSSPMDVIKIIISNFKLNRYFDYLITGDEVKRSKPAPDIFLKAAELLGVLPKECVVIEDSKNGIQAAKSAGMYCIGFLNLNSGQQDLSKADLVVDSLESIDFNNLNS
ncbi:HAD family hydrolase [Clostridium sp. LBM24168]